MNVGDIITLSFRGSLTQVLYCRKTAYERQRRERASGEQGTLLCVAMETRQSGKFKASTLCTSMSNESTK